MPRATVDVYFYIMKILFDNNKYVPPKVSIVLLDWSCRESFHSLDYLNKQTVPRKQYEIIWIEYYGRRSPEIEMKIKECERLGKPPIIDRWIVMDMPENVYYHKHLMYNIGIVAGSGEIIVFCDSDAIFSPTFVENIVRSFEEDKNIVLHIDEVRNTNKRFYPFNYPPIEEISGEGCINWRDGKTAGLIDKDDPLHTLNYGACMCALREDIINIGGADEHIDYLGHICGPYEMTFRLVNSGKKEIWHNREFIYHTWHPGTDGKNNYLGPHDGRNISATALNRWKTGHIMPLVENPAIRMLRLKQDDIIYVPLLLQAIPDKDIKNWTFENLGRHSKSFWKVENFINQPMLKVGLAMAFIKMLIKQLHIKVTKFSRQPKSVKEILKKVYRTYDFIKNMGHYNAYVLERCSSCLEKLKLDNIKEFAIYGTGDEADVLYKLASNSSAKIEAVYDDFGEGKFFIFDIMPVEEIKNYRGKIIITALLNTERRVELLKSMGIEDERILLL